MRKQFVYELNKQYCFMQDVSQQDIDNKTYKTTKFMVEDVVTRSEYVYTRRSSERTEILVFTIEVLRFLTLFE